MAVTPQNYKIPGPNVLIDPSQAGTPTSLKWILIAGHPTSAGIATPNAIVGCGTQADANALGGAGSMLARQFKAIFANVASVPIFLLPVPEPSAGTAATGTITVASAPQVAGVLALYVAGQLVSIGIAGSDTTAQVATKIAAAINAATDLPVTAVASAAVVTCTAKWKGLTGNDIRLEDSYLGRYGGEILPAGLALTYPANNLLTGGTGTPDFTAAIARVGDSPYKFLCLPHSDSGSYAVWDTEYGFGQSGRWGPYRQSYGQIFSARRGGYADQVTWGQTNNSPVISSMPFEPESPSPVWEWAATYTALAALSITEHPALPFQTLQLRGILPAPKDKRWNTTQLNALAQVGLAIQGTDVFGGQTNVPQIMREQTTYQKNSFGQADNAFELVTTLSTLDERYTRLRQVITNKFPRHKLANDGTKFASGLKIVTPLIIKAELINEYRRQEYDGLVENANLYIRYLDVKRSASEPNTVEVTDPPDIINQLRRMNITASFRLQFPITA